MDSKLAWKQGDSALTHVYSQISTIYFISLQDSVPISKVLIWNWNNMNIGVCVGLGACQCQLDKLCMHCDSCEEFFHIRAILTYVCNDNI